MKSKVGLGNFSREEKVDRKKDEKIRKEEGEESMLNLEFLDGSLKKKKS